MPKLSQSAGERFKTAQALYDYSLSLIAESAKLAIESQKMIEASHQVILNDHADNE